MSNPNLKDMILKYQRNLSNKYSIQLPYKRVIELKLFE